MGTSPLTQLRERLEALAEQLRDGGFSSQSGVSDKVTIEVRGPQGELKDRQETH